MRVYKRLLIIIFLFAVFPVKAFAVLPNITKAIETKTHMGTSEEILSFIEERRAQVVKLANEAEVILLQTDSPAEKEAIANAVDIFQGLSSQFQRLKSELKKSVDMGIKIPLLGAKPYPLIIFNNIRSFQKEIDRHLATHAKNIDDVGDQLEILERNLKSQLFDYSRMRTETPDGSFAFEKAAYIFSLQTKYSLLMLRLSRLRKQMDSLRFFEKEGMELIKICFENIYISAGEVAGEKKKLEKVALEEKIFLEKARNEINSLDNKLLHYELQLEKVEKKLQNEKENNAKNKSFKIEKRRISSIIDTIEVKRRNFEQKKLNVKINAIEAAFSYYWRKYYAGIKSEKSARDNIKSWRDKQDYLGDIFQSVNDSLQQASQLKIRAHKKRLMVADELNISPDKRIKDSLSSLQGQLLKENELVYVLITSLLDNQNDIRKLSEEIRWHLDLQQTKMPWHENLRAYFEKNLRNSWESAMSVLYYPFFSIGETNLTLAGILKFIFFLILSLAFLRLAFRKTASILQRKTNLSPGAVTSITTLGYYVAVVLVFFAILSSMGVNLNQLTVIFGALGVGIGFGLQTIANNFISGIILLTEQVIKPGDIVNLESGVIGEVQKVAIRSTIIRSVNGDDVIVPNSEFVSGRVNTWTYGDDWHRLIIPFGVSYASNPDEVVRLAEEAAREVVTTREDDDHPLRIFFENYGDSSLNFSIRVWCRMYQLNSLTGLRSDYYFALFRKLKNAGVEIPFPQRDLHLQSISSKAENSLKTFIQQEADGGSHTD